MPTTWTMKWTFPILSNSRWKFRRSPCHHSPLVICQRKTPADTAQSLENIYCSLQAIASESFITCTYGYVSYFSNVNIYFLFALYRRHEMLMLSEIMLKTNKDYNNIESNKNDNSVEINKNYNYSQINANYNTQNLNQLTDVLPVCCCSCEYISALSSKDNTGLGAAKTYCSCLDIFALYAQNYI